MAASAKFYTPVARNPTSAQVLDTVDLVDAANIATNVDLGTNFRVTLGGNRILDTPSGILRGGSRYSWIFVQDGAGGRTITLAAIFKTPGAAGITLSAGAGAVDVFEFEFDDTTDFLNLITSELDVR